MTVRETASILYGEGNWKIRGLPSLDLPSITVHDGPLGLRIGENGADPNDSKRPLAQSICYPSPALLACSFDREVLKDIGESFGLECRASKTDVLLGPGCNIKRNPLCGRNFEYYSEDPYLSGELAASFIKGIQSKGVGACLKHFACNSQEYFRMVNDSIVDERALHEIYLKPFEIAVKKGKPWMIMASYNKINGVYACDNRELLIDTLRDSWKYDGVTVSDWGAANDYIYNHNNGLDVEMPGMVDRKSDLINALNRKIIDKDAADASSERIINLLTKAKEGREKKVADFSANKAHLTCKEAAAKSIVLLKNDGMLPLKSYKKACVIGLLAKEPCLNGGGSSIVNPLNVVSFLDSTDGKGTRIPYAQGYNLNGFTDPDLAIEAIDLASKSDKVILFLGNNYGTESEGYDRSNMLLPDEQTRLFNQIYEVNKNIIVVLNVGSPVELPFRDKAKAILLCYLPGEAGGEALDDILLGVTCPSGHLAESWPIHFADVPSFGFYPGSQSQSLYRESLYVGYRYYVTIRRDVAYPFGYGLSYARIGYGEISASKSILCPGEEVTMSVEVINRSKFPCEHVVQIYLNPKKQNVFKPERFLVAFEKVTLEPESRKTVSIDIPYDVLSHYDKASKQMKVEAGEYLLEVGDDCVNIVASKKIVATSKDLFPSLQYSLPVYYNPGKDGFLSYDNDFEALLGRSVPLERDSRLPPYTLDSTITDISSTKTGKLLIKKANARLDFSGRDGKMLYAGFYELPLRNLAMEGIPQKTILGLLKLANGQWLRALGTMIFGYRLKARKKH